MSIPVNPVVVGEATKKSNFDTLYNGTVLVNTGGVAGGAQSIPGAKTFEDKMYLSSGFIASGTCTYYAPVAGEESMGTLVWGTQTSGNPYNLGNDSSLSSSWESVDVSALVPANAKGILLSAFVDAYSSGAATISYQLMFSDNNSLTPAIQRHAVIRGVVTASGAGQYCSGSSLVPIKLSSTKLFYYAMGSAVSLGASTIYMVMVGYYI